MSGGHTRAGRSRGEALGQRRSAAMGGARGGRREEDGGGAPEQRPAEFRPLEVRGAQEKAEVGEAKGNGSQMRGDRPRLPVPRDQPSTDKRLVFHSWDVPDDRRGFGDEAGAEG